MGLNWSTFILEFINFLVLVWILKHFLYAPVLAIIAKRRAAIAAGIAQAKKDREDAEALRDQYQNRLDEWQKERQKALEELQQETDSQRAEKLQHLQNELQEQRDKARIASERELDAMKQTLVDTALKQGTDFATRLLTPLADAALEAGLVTLMIAELQALPESLRERLRKAVESGQTVQVSSAFTLNEQQRAALTQAFANVLGREAGCEFREDPALLAGTRITLGAQVLEANLRDELKAFAEYRGVTETAGT